MLFCLFSLSLSDFVFFCLSGSSFRSSHWTQYIHKQDRAAKANRFHCKCILPSYYAKWKQYVHSDKTTEEGRRLHITHINITKSIEPYTRLSGSNKLNIGKSSLSSCVCVCALFFVELVCSFVLIDAIKLAIFNLLDSIAHEQKISTTFCCCTASAFCFHHSHKCNENHSTIITSDEALLYSVYNGNGRLHAHINLLSHIRIEMSAWYT